MIYSKEKIERITNMDMASVIKLKEDKEYDEYIDFMRVRFEYMYISDKKKYKLPKLKDDYYELLTKTDKMSTNYSSETALVSYQYPFQEYILLYNKIEYDTSNYFYPYDKATIDFNNIFKTYDIEKYKGFLKTGDSYIFYENDKFVLTYLLSLFNNDSKYYLHNFSKEDAILDCLIHLMISNGIENDIILNMINDFNCFNINHVNIKGSFDDFMDKIEPIMKCDNDDFIYLKESIYLEMYNFEQNINNLLHWYYMLKKVRIMEEKASEELHKILEECTEKNNSEIIFDSNGKISAQSLDDLIDYIYKNFILLCSMRKTMHTNIDLSREK